ncbi:DUF1638 domain-containing protein [Pseudooceanicola sp. HF7]|uniref:DUF1638 domain-containing protein n=1 Tax=Pseudooceanicola sp. HF7 TaxID=2721560 RepID=UPI0014304608|nr:DUF1638 domain-containing protein [Pseudooceanicola sp. HF7]NIZ08651.1 DUF1638 domain-containing protein [Pseudooceanicola sp. HF7]
MDLTLPDDATLTRDGFVPETRSGRVLVLACGALAREILALIELNGWDHVDLHCLPALLHNRPDRIPAAVEEAVSRRGADYEQTFVAYADCGTGGLLEATCQRLGVQMIPGAHCYAFFDGLATFAAREELTAFYLTDFLARQFESVIWKPLGLDRHPELRDMYFGNYETLVYLAQTEDAELTTRARAAADRLGLAFERRYTGYGELATVLAENI